MMKVFLINLDKDKDRLEAANAQLNRLGVAYERLPAIYAATMTQAERNESVSRFRWWCAVGRKPTNGEIGCALSHQAIYRRMIKENIPMACVLEDDVVLDDRFANVLAKVEKLDFGICPVVVLLSNHADWENKPGDGVRGFRTPEGEDQFYLKRTYWEMFAEGYVVTLAGAKALLRANAPLITACDQWMRWAERGWIELYHAFPTVCCQNKDDFSTNTLPGMKLVRDMGKCEYCLHKIKRVIGVLIDRALIKMLNR